MVETSLKKYSIINACKKKVMGKNILKSLYKTVFENRFYNLFIAMISIFAVGIIFLELSFDLNESLEVKLAIIDFSIWFTFVLDYFIRLFFSKNKKKFICSNKIDLISILPIDAIFKGIRVLKIGKAFKVAKISKMSKLSKSFKIFKMTAFMAKAKYKFDVFLKTNNFRYTLILTIFIVFFGAASISVAEGMSFGDSLWWSFVTTTTVGYGDISPATTTGRIVASTLMITGIGFIGMLTGTIATFFLKDSSKEVSYNKSIVDDAIVRLEKFQELSEEDLKDMFNVLMTLKNNK